MKYTIATAFAALALGAAIASCGNNGNVATATSTPSPVATPSAPCTPPPNTQIQVVYPQPLSTGISTGQIVVAVAPSPLPTNYKLYVTVYDTASNTFLGTTFGQALQTIPFSQVPQPSLNPPFAPPFFYETSSFGGTFGANDTFHVFLANTNCYPGTDLNASFKT